MPKPVHAAALTLAAMLSVTSAWAQRTLAPVPAAAAADGRVALVIGNSSYKDAPLANPVNDATDMAKTLREAGFKVILRRNAGTREMRAAIREFGQQLRRADAGLFYFAGHGIQVRGNNYLIPVGADIQSEADVEDLAIDAGYALRTMEESQVKVSIVILDACRNNPFSRSFRSASRGLAQMTAATGSVIAFSTAPGSLASDGGGRNGLYTKHLLASLAHPDTDILKVFQRTRANVVKETGGKQMPWESTSLIGDFYFRQPAAAAPPAPASQPASQLASISPGLSAHPSLKESADAAVVVADFTGHTPEVARIAAVVRENLARGGMRGLEAPPGTGPWTEASPINYREWQERSTDAVVAGSVIPLADGRVEVRFRLYDVRKGVPLGGLAYVSAREQLRPTAHRISDYVFEKLTGYKGVFSTRLAYVMRDARVYELHIADTDGSEAQYLLRSHQSITSPVFSKDGRRVAYVSFEDFEPDDPRPGVYVHDLSAQRRTLALKPGQRPPGGFRAMSVVWMPDQIRLFAMASSREGTRFYTALASGAEMRLVAQVPSQDGEPTFSADGEWLYFTSDRSGSRQIWRMRPDSSEATQITRSGGEAFSPSISPDGMTLAFVSRGEAGTHVAALDLASSRLTVVARGFGLERTSFSPNGRYVLFAAEAGGRRVLQVGSIDGRELPGWRLSRANTLLSQPVWGPSVE